jgi:hypothetical protein
LLVEVGRIRFLNECSKEIRNKEIKTGK